MLRRALTLRANRTATVRERPRHLASTSVASSPARLGFACALLALASAGRADPIPLEVGTAVDDGLRYLATQQRGDGQWFTSQQLGRSTAVTSLACLAFMARGHTPGQGPYGANLNRGIDYILSVGEDATKRGVLADGAREITMYDHGISTVMLCEAYGMVDPPRQERMKRVVGNAIWLILSAQRVRKSPGSFGGWRYHPNSADSDISVSGWQIMALRGAANIGAYVPPANIQAGLTYIRARATSDGGFAYIGGGAAGNAGSSAARTGTGVLALELLGQHESKEAIAGGQYLLRNPIGRDTPFFYYAVYYCSQAAYQLGGKYNDEVNGAIRKTLLAAQNKRTGAWSALNSPEPVAGEAYATSMAILALTVPYKYLPLYQK